MNAEQRRLSMWTAVGTHRTPKTRPGGCGQSVLERLADLIRPNPEDDPEWLRLEEEKLTKARLALFGAAPK